MSREGKSVMTRESQEFVRDYLLKEPEFAAPILVQGFMDACTKRADNLGLNCLVLAKRLGIMQGRFQAMMNGCQRTQIHQFVKLASVLGCHVELKLVVDHHNRPFPGRYNIPGRPELGMPGIPADIALHPMAQSNDCQPIGNTLAIPEDGDDDGC
jgi:hypothetical protein